MNQNIYREMENLPNHCITAFYENLSFEGVDSCKELTPQIKELESQFLYPGPQKPRSLSLRS